MFASQGIVGLGMQNFFPTLLGDVQMIHQQENPVFLKGEGVDLRKPFFTGVHQGGGLSPASRSVGVYQQGCGQIAQQQSLGFHGGVGLAAVSTGQRSGFLNHPFQHCFRVGETLQLVGIRYALSHIADAVIVHEQVQGGDTFGAAAGEGGVFVIFIEHVL